MEVISALFRLLILAALIGIGLYLFVFIGAIALVALAVLIVFIYGRAFFQTFFGGGKSATTTESMFEEELRHDMDIHHPDGGMTIEGEFEEISEKDIPKKD